MEGKTTVIFLDYFENLEKVYFLVKKVCAKLKCPPIIVSSNFDAQPLAVQSGSKMIYFNDLLSRQDYEFMDRYVLNLIQNWYSGLKPVEGVSEYKGIQLGSLIEERADAFFASAIRNLEIVLKIIERFKPDRIILIGQKDNFRDLSIFINGNLNTPSLFIELKERNSSISEAVNNLRRIITEKVSNICDNIMQMVMTKNKIKNGIFIDAQLYFKLKDLIKEYRPILYLIEKGFRIRLRLIKNEKLFYVPILAENSTKRINLFSRFYRYWRFIKADNKFKNKFNYRDLNIWRVVEKNIKSFIIYNFPQVRKNIVLSEKLYKRMKPKVVIAREAVRMPEKAIVSTARQAGVPTLVIQHGILTDGNAYRRLQTDKIALWGKVGIDWYLAHGNDITKCIVTGKLQHDQIYSRKNDYEADGKNLLLKIGADPDKEVILYVPSIFKIGIPLTTVYITKDSESFALNSILNIAESFPDKQLIIKIHPFDLVNLSSLRDNPKIKKFANIFIVKNADIIPLIKISSLVITSLFSSSALDAVIFNKPLITLNFYKRDDFVPFSNRGVALSVTNPESLSQAVRQIFEDKKLENWFISNRESFIYDYAYKIDGQSWQRVKDLIRELAHNA